MKTPATAAKKKLLVKTIKAQVLHSKHYIWFHYF